MKNIPQRQRIFIAGEGEGEQSFVKWLQQLTDQKKLHVHLDFQLLGGGGYRTMLEHALQGQLKKNRSKARFSVLLVDGDRDLRGDDGWCLLKLKEEANKKNIQVCVQNPNLEGIFFRLFSGKEKLQPDAKNVNKKLLSVWPDYKKPVDAYSISNKFNFTDLHRASRFDDELSRFLNMIGFQESLRLVKIE